MKRLTNDAGVQIVVTDEKAARLIAGNSALTGRFEAVPEEQQAHTETEHQEQLAAARSAERKARKGRSGPTSLATALAHATGVHG